MTGYDWFILLFAIPAMLVVGALMLFLVWLIGREIWEHFRYDR